MRGERGAPLTTRPSHNLPLSIPSPPNGTPATQATKNLAIWYTTPKYFKRQFIDISDIIEGDILADQVLLRWIEKSDVNRQKREVVKGVNGENRLWKNGLIPYVISGDICKYTRYFYLYFFNLYISCPTTA